MGRLGGPWPWAGSRARSDAHMLVAAVSGAARQPALFGPGRLPDSMDARLEAVTLFASLAFIRVRREPGAGPLAQHFADALFRHLDAGLREAGVGDLAVPRRMRKIAAAFYGRLEAYASALAAGEPGALEAALVRNMLGEAGAGFAPALAAHAFRLAEIHSGAPLAALFDARAWPEPPG